MAEYEIREYLDWCYLPVYIEARSEEEAMEKYENGEYDRLGEYEVGEIAWTEIAESRRRE